MPNGSSPQDTNERKGIRVYVAGARGMVGSALCRRLQGAGYTLVQPPMRVDLRDQKATHELIRELKPDWVFLAAAKVGGIYANNTYPAEFIYDNIMIQSNVIHASYEERVKKLLLLGSSCIYPKFAPQPLKEEYLLTGSLEPTNEPYAVAKIAAIIMARSYNHQYGTNFLSVMPTNLYGPNDNFDLQTSHVVAALIRKTYEAAVSGAEFVEVWGTGTPLREFLHVDDMTAACLFLMEREDAPKLVNIGYGSDISVRDLALLMKEIAGYDGEIRFNPAMPDGTPRKLLDSSLLTSLGWKPSIPLREGLTAVYRWYVENADWHRR